MNGGSVFGTECKKKVASIGGVLDIFREEPCRGAEKGKCPDEPKVGDGLFGDVDVEEG